MSQGLLTSASLTAIEFDCVARLFRALLSRCTNRMGHDGLPHSMLASKPNVHSDAAQADDVYATFVPTSQATVAR